MAEEMVTSFVDSASMYEVIAALSFSDVSECYQWAWQSALLVSDAMIDIEHLQLSPSPGPSGGASGSYALLMEGVRPFVGISRPGKKVLNKALAETRTWTHRHADLVHSAVEELGADEHNFKPWLYWVARNAWLENVQRRGSLIDSQLIREVARALNVPEKDVQEIAALVTDQKEVEVFARRLENQSGFDLLWRVYLASALIRGVFHEQVARQENWQAWRHPLRRHVLKLSSGQEPHRIPQFDTFLANIIVAGALSHPYGKHDTVMERRINAWIDNVQRCRGKDIRRPPEDASVDQALSAAVNEARRLGVAIAPRYLDKAISVTSGLALGVIGVLFGHFVSPEAGDIAGIALGEGGYLIDPGSLLIGPERRLREYAQLGPGRADAVD